MKLQRPMVYSARRLRKEMTLPEVLLWQQLRDRPGGLKFRRQHPIGHYVADFFCREASLIVEVDGAAHDAATLRDEARDARLRQLGMNIVRVPAEEVLQDPQAVAEGLVAAAQPPLHQPSAGPPPRSGEDLGSH